MESRFLMANPNQPRDADGKWTKAYNAARKASDLPPEVSHQAMMVEISEWAVTPEGKVVKAEPLTAEEKERYGDRKGHEYLEGSRGYWRRDMKEFPLRGVYGKLEHEGKIFDVVTFYKLKHGMEEIDLFNTYYNKILDKINKSWDYSPAIYYTNDFFKYQLYDVRKFKSG